MRVRAALPAACLFTALITSATAQKAPPPASQTAPASLPGQADVENAATAARAWMEHVVGGILDGSPVDERAAPQPRRDR